MCGRYDLDATAEELAERFGIPLRDVSVNLEVAAGPAANTSAAWQPSYNIAPSQHNPVIVEDAGGHNRLQLMRWGLVPAWSRDAKVPYSTINARAETVASKPAFRKSLASRRCLVPATGYFEWVEAAPGAAVSQGKQPYRIRLRPDATDSVDNIFAFAGLYDIWHGPAGEELQTYTIITTTANDALSAIHSRMPVILPRDLEEAWLDQHNHDIDKLTPLLQPYPEEAMTAYPVSRLLNKPGNDSRALIEPIPVLAS